MTRSPIGLNGARNIPESARTDKQTLKTVSVPEVSFIFAASGGLNFSQLHLIASGVFGLV
jgi:hypothetical protein